MSSTVTWRQQDGGAVGKEPMRFTIRWDASMGGYRVTIPSLEGPIQVVPSVAYDDMRIKRDRLQEAIDTAHGAMHASQYVGGLSEQEAWQTAMHALGSVVTEHKGVPSEVAPLQGQEESHGG